MDKLIIQEKTRTAGIPIFSIAILLMLVGAIMEHATDYTDLGATIFTIGFWLFFIPIIFIVVVLLIMLAIAVAVSR